MIPQIKFNQVAASVLALAIFALVFASTKSDNFSVQASVDPELPRVYLNSDLAGTPVTGKSLVANDSQEFREALIQAQPGDEIVLLAGMTYTGPFELPNKPSVSGWITIRTSDISNLPQPGVRVAPSDRSAMAKIVAPGRNEPALTTEDGAHHYRIIGIEFTKSKPSDMTTNLIYLGRDNHTEMSQIPHHIILDRIYAHGDPASNLRRCVSLNTAFTSIIDSYIADCHERSADAQAIAGWSGPGPFKIVNNYLEASGENLMFGGSDTKIVDLIPSDIEIRKNYFSKPLSWMPGQPGYTKENDWSIKNIFELKAARRVLVDGNIFENNWSDSQTGVAILFKSAANNKCSWCVTEHVTFSNNIVRNAAGGLTINAAEGYTGVMPKPANNILIRNVLFENINKQWRAGGRLIQIFGGVDNVTIDHVTGFADYSTLQAEGENKNLVITNSILQRPEYGIGTGADEGKKTLTRNFPGFEFSNNVLLNTSEFSKDYLEKAYPSGTKIASGYNGVGFVDPVNGNYKLSDNSAYKNGGKDGKDIGVDFDALKLAVAGVASGNPSDTPPPSAPTPSPIPLPDPVPAPNPAPIVNNGSNNGGSGGGSNTVISNPVIVPPVVNTSPIDNPKFRPGTLIKSRVGSTVYLVDGAYLRPFTSGEQFVSLGYSFAAVQIVPDSDLIAMPVDAQPFTRPVGSLIKYKNSPEIYFLNNNKQKRPFTSWQSFVAWQNKIENVVTIPESEQYQTGSPVEFPNGAVIKGQGPEVYLIEGGKARPFGSAQAFLSKGFKFSEIAQISDGELAMHPKGEILN